MRPAILLLVALGLGAPAAAPDQVLVQSLVRDGRVEVSFQLQDGFTDDLRAAIKSGLPAAITYEIELRRHVFLWYSRTLAHATVTASVQFDNLTRHHQLMRTIDGRGEEPQVTADEELVRHWLTSGERLALFATDGLEANAEYSVRVRARTRPRVSWAFWPWDRGGAAGQARFTFIR